jgi:hypothetical protein
MWRPEDFRQLQRMWREMEQVRLSAEEFKVIQAVAREQVPHPRLPTRRLARCARGHLLGAAY